MKAWVFFLGNSDTSLRNIVHDLVFSFSLFFPCILICKYKLRLTLILKSQSVSAIATNKYCKLLFLYTNLFGNTVYIIYERVCYCKYSDWFRTRYWHCKYEYWYFTTINNFPSYQATELIQGYICATLHQFKHETLTSLHTPWKTYLMPMTFFIFAVKFTNLPCKFFFSKISLLKYFH